MQGEPRIELAGERSVDSLSQTGGSPKKARTQRATETDLTSLPTELIFRILGYLDPVELSLASGLNKFFHVLSLDDELWKALAYEYLGCYVRSLSSSIALA
jgi:hypothetical protein